MPHQQPSALEPCPGCPQGRVHLVLAITIFRLPELVRRPEEEVVGADEPVLKDRTSWRAVRAVQMLEQYPAELLELERKQVIGRWNDVREIAICHEDHAT